MNIERAAYSIILRQDAQPCKGKEHCVVSSIIPAMSRVMRDIDRIIRCGVETQRREKYAGARTKRHRLDFTERTEVGDVNG